MGNISFRPKNDIPERLDQVAATLDRNRTWVINEALEEYLDRRSLYVAEIQRRSDWARQNPEKLIPNEKAMADFLVKVRAIRDTGK